MFWWIALYAAGALLTFGFQLNYMVKKGHFRDLGSRTMMSLLLGAIWLVWTPFTLMYLWIRYMDSPA